MKNIKKSAILFFLLAIICLCIGIVSYIYITDYMVHDIGSLTLDSSQHISILVIAIIPFIIGTLVSTAIGISILKNK